MIKFGINCWLTRPWRCMSYGDNFRHYNYFDDKHRIEQNLLIIRTSEKCYKVINWRINMNFKGISKIETNSFRSFREVAEYARTIV